MIKVFACDWNSNGTNDLIKTNDSEITECLSEALFGYRLPVVLHRELELSMIFEDFVGAYDDDYANDDYQGDLCKEIDLVTALRYAAVSPTQTKSESVSAIKALFNGVDQD